MSYEDRYDAMSDYNAEIIADQEEEYSYIQLYDYTTECFCIIRIKESDAKRIHEIISEVQEDDNYDVPMFYDALAKESINYESVEPERVYF